MKSFQHIEMMRVRLKEVGRTFLFTGIYFSLFLVFCILVVLDFLFVLEYMIKSNNQHSFVILTLFPVL